MEPISISNKDNVIEVHAVNSMDFSADTHVDLTESDPIIDKLTEEGYESFYDYLIKLGLAKDPDILILPSSNHYYFEVCPAIMNDWPN